MDRKKLVSILIAISFVSIVSYTSVVSFAEADNGPWNKAICPYNLSDINNHPNKLQVDDYDYYLYKGLCSSSNGTIATYVCAYENPTDGAPGDLYFTRSFDSGVTWSPLVPFCDGSASYLDNGNTYDDRSVLSSGLFFDNNDTLWSILWVDGFHYEGDYSEVHLGYSTDYGNTWVGIDDNYMINESCGAIDLDDQTNHQTIYAPRPLTKQPVICENDRVIIPTNSYYSNPTVYLYAIYSDDTENLSRSTWHLGYETTSAEAGAGGRVKATIGAELNNHTVLYTTRRDSGGRDEHWSENSTYGVVEFGGFHDGVPAGVDTGSRLQTYTRNSTWGDNGGLYNKTRYLLFVKVGSYLNIGVSYDECETWEYLKITNLTAVRHSAVLSNGSIIIADATGDANNDYGMVLYNLEYLTGNNDHIEKSEESEIQFISIENQGDNADVYVDTPTINWTNVSDAILYHLEIDNNADFSSPEINYTDINKWNYPTYYEANSTRVSFTLPDAIVDYGTYYMRVRAYT